MAKKHAPKKAAKKAGKKAGAKRPDVDPNAPVPISSGKGPGPGEVGAGVLAMINAGKREDAIWAKWFSPKLVSIEGQMGMAWHGLKAVKGKAEWWYQAHKVHSMRADGPFVGATCFAIRFTIDVEELASGKRWQGEEFALYTVLNGKVIQEEFLGRPMPVDHA